MNRFSNKEGEKVKAIGYGERIEQIRKSMKLTLEQFGKLFDPPASKGLVRNWEIENNLPNKDRLLDIAMIGNVTVDYIIYGESNQNILEKNNTNIDPQKVGQRIKQIRLLNGWTMEHLGRLLGGSPKSTIATWESGRNLPKKKYIDKLAEISQVTAEWILLGEEDFKDIIINNLKIENTKLIRIINDIENTSYEKKINPLAVGKRIKELRQLKGWTMEELGEKSDNSPRATVSNWERGTNFPSKKKLLLLANVGETTIDWLLSGQIDLKDQTIQEQEKEIKSLKRKIEQIKEIVVNYH
ncbi:MULTISPECIES: helix-turn-helix transcriptional regulator [Vagococcus]|uniref:Prophage ps3 protein 15 n=1 Tax=Vagococcus fluvialis bH819 TaxID=1255619 RepID=A0A1X6WSB0_9ENTE|nr:MULTISPECIES: helix-turn-helix transcriptional regulator [Vagococcus]SLM87122.1 prophage ps3 protein 15 [Vagococcus fluvialis bH819]HCM90599.1 XRE family transcriptional regulator [Vagococcus sp.]